MLNDQNWRIQRSWRYFRKFYCPVKNDIGRIGPNQFCAESTYTRTCAQSARRVTNNRSLPEACNLGVSFHGAFAAPSLYFVARVLSAKRQWRRKKHFQNIIQQP